MEKPRGLAPSESKHAFGWPHFLGRRGGWWRAGARSLEDRAAPIASAPIDADHPAGRPDHLRGEEACLPCPDPRSRTTSPASRCRVGSPQP
jgi:hypothetical protein